MKLGKSCATHPVCSHVILHKMRKTFASTLRHKGLPAQTLQGCLRHSDLSTPIAYIADQPDDQSGETINAILPVSVGEGNAAHPVRSEPHCAVIETLLPSGIATGSASSSAIFLRQRPGANEFAPLAFDWVTLGERKMQHSFGRCRIGIGPVIIPVLSHRIGTPEEKTLIRIHQVVQCSKRQHKAFLFLVRPSRLCKRCAKHPLAMVYSSSRELLPSGLSRSIDRYQVLREPARPGYLRYYKIYGYGHSSRDHECDKS
jgi:hypothetical protein